MAKLIQLIANPICIEVFCRTMQSQTMRHEIELSHLSRYWSSSLHRYYYIVRNLIQKLFRALAQEVHRRNLKQILVSAAAGLDSNGATIFSCRDVKCSISNL